MNSPESDHSILDTFTPEVDYTEYPEFEQTYTNQSMETSNLLLTTIQLDKLSLGDWIALEQAKGNKPGYGWYQYLKFSEVETLNFSLNSLELSDWVHLATVLEFKQGWAIHFFNKCAKVNYEYDFTQEVSR